MKRRAVWIQWSDAADHGAGEWLDGPPKDTVCVINSVGILIGKNRTHYTITHSVDDDGKPRGAFSIPKSTVLSIRDLDAV